MICKNNEDYGFYLELFYGSEDKEVKCLKCFEGNNRVEKYVGFVVDGRLYFEIEWMYMGKIVINYFIKIVFKGSLFIFVLVVKICVEGIVFEGFIEGIFKEDIEKIKKLRIGKYILSGFGIVCLFFGNSMENEKEDELREKVK